MKKLITLLLFLSLGAGLVACSSAAENTKEEAKPTAETEDDGTGEEATEDGEKKSLKKSEGNRMERPQEDE